MHIDGRMSQDGIGTEAETYPLRPQFKDKDVGDGEKSESGVDLDATSSDATGATSSAMASRVMARPGSGENEAGDTDAESGPSERLMSVSDEENVRQPDIVIQADELYKTETPLESSSKTDSSFRKRMKLMCRKEFIICFVGALALLVGIILIAVSVAIRQCPSQQPHSEYGSESQDHTSHDHHTTSNHVHQDLVTGTYVSVIHNDDHNATRDVEPINLAEGKDATQSSTNQESGQHFYAGLAVDGQKGHRFAQGTCSQTEWEHNTYWFADLGKLQLVKTVKIVIPNDCCAGEMHNFEVRVGQQRDLSLNPLCQLHLGTALKISITIVCERQLYGRYVSIQILGDETRRSNRLTLCEVLVYKD